MFGSTFSRYVGLDIAGVLTPVRSSLRRTTPGKPYLVYLLSSCRSRVLVIP